MTLPDATTKVVLDTAPGFADQLVDQLMLLP